jgi:hypothetical protein
MVDVEDNIVRPGEGCASEARNNKENAIFILWVGPGAKRKSKGTLRDEISKFRDFASERVWERDLGVSLPTNGRCG